MYGTSSRHSAHLELCLYLRGLRSVFPRQKDLSNTAAFNYSTTAIKIWRWKLSEVPGQHVFVSHSRTGTSWSLNSIARRKHDSRLSGLTRSLEIGANAEMKRISYMKTWKQTLTLFCITAHVLLLCGSPAWAQSQSTQTTSAQAAPAPPSEAPVTVSVPSGNQVKRRSSPSARFSCLRWAMPPVSVIRLQSRTNSARLGQALRIWARVADAKKSSSTRYETYPEISVASRLYEGFQPPQIE